MIKKFFAEHNFDEYIRNKFFSDYSKPGTIVEVGAATPDFISMSRHFKLNNWRTIVVEPNPHFVELHKQLNNEIYPYACSFENKDDVDFTLVHVNNGQITNHSFSSFYIKEEYIAKNHNWPTTLPKTTIKVKQRTLDFILQEANVNEIDLLVVDVEGWEIEVIKGLTRIKPKLIILENIFNNMDYRRYMVSIGYSFLEHRYNDDVYTLVS